MEWFAIAFVLMSILDAIAKSKKKKQKLAAMRAESGDDDIELEAVDILDPEPAAASLSGEGSHAVAVASPPAPVRPDPSPTSQPFPVGTSRGGISESGARPAAADRVDATETVETVARLMGLDSLLGAAQTGGAPTESGPGAPEDPQPPRPAPSLPRREQPPPYRPPRSAVPERTAPADPVSHVGPRSPGPPTVHIHGSRRDMPADPSYLLDTHRHQVSDDLHAMLRSEGRAGLRRAVVLREVFGPPLGIEERRTG